MKLPIMMAIFMCGSALAEVPTVKASKLKCDELKELVEKYGAVNVKKKTLGIFTSTKFVQHKANCSADQYTRNFRFKTLDNRACVVGEFCENPYVHTDSGTTTHDWPTYDSPGSDRGPSYDPPSPSDRGPSYDPQSRDYEGPRYCPNC